eukprot:GEZU01032436.1.p1 GENE.GEZU01032436.1~~GEZU01032436.1.p1  ORF type:complete len:280 (+),score=47.67 GEZU01032436.1:466-1305(+)
MGSSRGMETICEEKRQRTRLSVLSPFFPIDHARFCACGSYGGDSSDEGRQPDRRSLSLHNRSQQSHSSSLFSTLIPCLCFLLACSSHRAHRQKNITTGVKLLVDNLHYGVSSEDIRSLFAEFSDVKKAEVVYDKSGRSLGKAYVVLSSREAAEAAIKKYDGVNLDEQPMKISIVGGTGTGRSGSSAPLMTSTGLKISAGGSGGRRVVVERDAGKPVRRGGSFTSRNRDEGRGSRQTARRGGRGGGRGGSRAGGKEPKPTAESLDAELDNYRAQAMEQDQ